LRVIRCTKSGLSRLAAQIDTSENRSE